MRYIEKNRAYQGVLWYTVSLNLTVRSSNMHTKTELDNEFKLTMLCHLKEWLQSIKDLNDKTQCNALRDDDNHPSQKYNKFIFSLSNKCSIDDLFILTIDELKPLLTDRYLFLLDNVSEKLHFTCAGAKGCFFSTAIHISHSLVCSNTRLHATVVDHLDELIQLYIAHYQSHSQDKSSIATSPFGLYPKLSNSTDKVCATEPSITTDEEVDFVCATGCSIS
ncbi:MAG: hypothetical protein CK424_04895 [Legionella sp.]|nr:MAG: hypothetical protein CK424_04895 [Legionella sp.]